MRKIFSFGFVIFPLSHILAFCSVTRIHTHKQFFLLLLNVHFFTPTFSLLLVICKLNQTVASSLPSPPNCVCAQRIPMRMFGVWVCVNCELNTFVLAFFRCYFIRKQHRHILLYMQTHTHLLCTYNHRQCSSLAKREVICCKGQSQTTDAKRSQAKKQH